MASYSVEFKRSVEKDLKAVPKKDQIRILQRVAQLSEDPRPLGSKKISGQERYRIRQGNYRILYEIKDEKLIVVVVKIGNRRDICR